MRTYVIKAKDFFDEGRHGYWTGHEWSRDDRAAWPFNLRVSASECRIEMEAKHADWPKGVVIEQV